MLPHAVRVPSQHPLRLGAVAELRKEDGTGPKARYIV